MKYIVFTLTLWFVLACEPNNQNDKTFILHGAWMLKQVDYPIGHTEKYIETNGTLLRLYDGNSVMYQCWLVKTESGLIVKPHMQCKVTLINKGNSEYLYLEDDDPRPLTVKDDSTIVIQQNGVLYTWLNADENLQEWDDDIMAIVATDLQKEKSQDAHSYMLSAKERKQASVIHWFIISSIGGIILLLLICRIAIDNRKARQRLQLQLQQIKEVQEERPLQVRQAIESVETAYFASDEYHALQRRIATVQRLKDDDWLDIEGQIRKVYPGFSSQLRGLYTMSELEYQVCILVKLRIAPKDIAAVLARDVSTISTVRSRLYQKVFSKKGGAKEWDEFILSI